VKVNFTPFHVKTAGGIRVIAPLILGRRWVVNFTLPADLLPGIQSSIRKEYDFGTI